jgi:nucleoside-diphosphate-sugar epimerase
LREGEAAICGLSIPVSLGSMGGTLQTLVTGVSGYAGAALVPRLVRDGHAVRGFARSRERVAATGAHLEDLVVGDATTGQGLD